MIDLFSEIDGKVYHSITGTSVEYGTTFKHLVAGGLMGDGGAMLPLTGMTNMGTISASWFFTQSTKPGEPHGDSVPKQVQFQLTVQSGHVLDVDVALDQWKHSFLMQNGNFDVHERQALYTFTVRKQPTATAVLSRVQGVGLLEFGTKLNHD